MPGLTRSNYPDVLEPILAEVFVDDFTRHKSLIGEFCAVSKSKKAIETSSGRGAGRPMPVFTGSISYDTPSRRYKVTSEHITFADGIMIEQELIEDNQYPEMFNLTKGLSDNAFLRKEAWYAKLFNLCTSTAVDPDGFVTAGGDGVALASAAHPSNPDGTGPTQSNILSGAVGTTGLNATNLGTALTSAMLFRDDRGNPTISEFDTLLFPTALWKEANIALNTPQAPGGGDNDDNSVYHMLKPYKYRYINGDVGGSSTNWFLIDSAMAKRHVTWWDRTGMQFQTTPDFDNFNMKVAVRKRWSLRSSDWRWIFAVIRT